MCFYCYEHFKNRNTHTHTYNTMFGCRVMQSTRELTDPERLLAMFEVASNVGIPIDESNVESYVYLLKVNDIPFTYSFVFHPLPHSAELRRDILGLRMAGYIRGASLVITRKGSKFVKQVILPEFEELLDRIRKYLKEFRLMDRTGLFEAVYARIV